jgi:succinate dehydrogenase/fumarate reductase flavoprotein subunit
MAKHKTHYEDCDVLVVGGGMAGTGATFEARHWGRDMKIICVEKANIDRSGAVAKVFMQSTVTWECSGVKTNLRITLDTQEMI